MFIVHWESPYLQWNFTIATNLNLQIKEMKPKFKCLRLRENVHVIVFIYLGLI